jgi:hypothetical protein
MELTKRGRGRPPKAPDFRTMLADSVPSADIFDEGEKKMYENLVNIYLKDFDEDQLTANDMDDIMSISMNRVLEFRLLKASKKDPSKQIDASTAIERLRKQTDKLKESLGSRRKDRIDPRKFSGFSIVDLAVNFDAEKKKALYGRDTSYRSEEDTLSNSDLMVGNKDDEDAGVVEIDD